MTWTPSDDVRAIGNELQGAFPYVRGSMTSAAEPRVQRAVGAGTAALGAFLRSRWGLSSAGTVRAASMSSPAQRADGSWRRRDLHEDGRAIDAMIGRDLSKGYEIANFLVTNAAALGVQYLVFDGLDWCVSTVGAAFEPVATSQDRAAWGRRRDMHTDHVHIELTPALAANGDAMRAVLESLTGALVAAGRPAGGSSSQRTPAPPAAPAPPAGAPQTPARSVWEAAPAPANGIGVASALVVLVGAAVVLDIVRKK